MFSIERATEKDIKDIVQLFDQYRVFYNQSSDEKAAELFLQDRFDRGECTVFIARNNGIPIGFTLLYTSFSSVSMQPVFILNDLYVSMEHRNKGIGKMLLEKAKDYCIENGYKGLALETAIDNPAQKLYEKLGWIKDSHCFHYFWSAP